MRGNAAAEAAGLGSLECWRGARAVAESGDSAVARKSKLAAMQSQLGSHRAWQRRKEAASTSAHSEPQGWRQS